MFNRSTAQILAWKSNLQREENPKKPLESDWDRQISAHYDVRSPGLVPLLVVEVGGVTDGHMHYANLTQKVDVIL